MRVFFLFVNLFIQLDFSFKFSLSCSSGQDFQLRNLVKSRRARGKKSIELVFIELKNNFKRFINSGGMLGSARKKPNLFKKKKKKKQRKK